MQVLLSSIGSRGDVQPLVALGVELQALGHRARLCVAPNFCEWIESYGLECVPIGPDLKKLTGGTVARMVPRTSEEWKIIVDASVREQFAVLTEAARGCDVLVGAGALQIALRSIADAQHTPYLFAAYCPAVLPSTRNPPPKNSDGSYPQDLPQDEIVRLWKQNDDEFNARFGAVLNDERGKLGLSPVSSVRDTMFTDHPWLAADPVLAPAYPIPGLDVTQTGAWMISETTPLPVDVEAFLAAGAPPVYLGFGSMQALEQTGRKLIDAARALGLRSVLSQGWAGLEPGEMGDDCLTIGDLNHAALFPRMAAIVHHGGAGTTQTAARAGRPQVLIPHNYDQFYWAHRVQEMGVGVSGPTRDDLTVDALVAALRLCLQPDMAARAQELASRMEPHGAHNAAERLTREYA